MCVITVVQHCWNVPLFYFIDPSFSLDLKLKDYIFSCAPFGMWSKIKSRKLPTISIWFLPAVEMLFFSICTPPTGGAAAVLHPTSSPNTLSLRLIWTKLHILCRQDVQNVWFHNVFTVHRSRVHRGSPPYFRDQLKGPVCNILKNLLA